MGGDPKPQRMRARISMVDNPYILGYDAGVDIFEAHHWIAHRDFFLFFAVRKLKCPALGRESLSAKITRSQARCEWVARLLHVDSVGISSYTCISVADKYHAGMGASRN